MTISHYPIVGKYGGLNNNDPHRVIGSSSVRACGLVGVDVALTDTRCKTAVLVQGAVLYIQTVSVAHLCGA